MWGSRRATALHWFITKGRITKGRITRGCITRDRITRGRITRGRFVDMGCQERAASWLYELRTCYQDYCEILPEICDLKPVYLPWKLLRNIIKNMMSVRHTLCRCDAVSLTFPSFRDKHNHPHPKLWPPPMRFPTHSRVFAT